MEYRATIGLEVHAQLATRTKMFCACPVVGEAPPNSAVCPICLGHPGTLPCVNDAAIGLALRAGLALSCTLHPTSIFARKHYFYPDLPKGYQISQYDRPLCTDGAIHALVGGERRRFEIVRIHLEEDAGRMHHGGGGSRVDWNRGGVPLIEIVGAPDLHEPEEAEAWLRMLHRVLTTAGVCPGDLEKGHFRCDANVSVARPGQPWGTRVEVKNINSFRFVAKALRFEIDRQISVLEAGGAVDAETRTWAGRGTVSLRKKETSADYRYFPEPDLPPLRVSPDEIAAARAALPAAPLDQALLDEDAARLASFRERTGLGAGEAAVLLAAPDLTAWYEAAVAAGGDPRSIAAWVMTDLLRWLKDAELSACAMRPDQLVALDRMVQTGALTRGAARGLLDELFRTGADPAALVAARGLGAVSDEGAVRAATAEVLAAHPDELARYRAGRRNLTGFFVGAVMKRFSGRADARQVGRIVQEALDSE